MHSAGRVALATHGPKPFWCLRVGGGGGGRYRNYHGNVRMAMRIHSPLSTATKSQQSQRQDPNSVLYTVFVPSGFCFTWDLDKSGAQTITIRVDITPNVFFTLFAAAIQGI